MKKLVLKKFTTVKFSILTLLLSMILFIACTQDNNSIENLKGGGLRESFLKDKEFETIKSDFNSLTEKEKINLWNEKLEQLLFQNLPNDHNELIKQLKQELNESQINVENISNISIQLAAITPEDDFYKMFTTLENYNYEGHFRGKTLVNDEFKKSLNSLKFNYIMNPEISNLTLKNNGRKPCNCNWTCSLYAGGSSSNCETTRSGCGFLWAFECEERVGPTAAESFPNDQSEVIYP